MSASHVKAKEAIEHSDYHFPEIYSNFTAS